MKTLYAKDVDQLRERLEAMLADLDQGRGQVAEDLVQVDVAGTGDRGDRGKAAAIEDVGIELAQAEDNLLQQVEEALLRIEEGSYGRCVECSRKVDRERLFTLPYAALCIDCARGKPSSGRL